MYSQNWLSIGFLAVLPFVAAECTTFSISRANTESASTGLSNEFEMVIDTLSCPGKTACKLAQKDYTLTIPPSLNISSDTIDTTNIFSLVQTAFASYQNQNNTQPFTSYSGTVSTSSLTLTQQNVLIVQPGMSKNLTWIPFMRYAYGTLGGCSNSTLEGMGVRAVATYLNVVNGTGMNETLSGTFGATGANITASSVAGERRGKGALSGVVVGVCAVGFAGFL